MWITIDHVGRVISFRVETTPVPWQRPRTDGRSGRWFVDRTSQRCRDAIREVASQNGSLGLAFVVLTIEAIIPRPKKASYPFPTIGDLDNHCKMLEDSIQGISFADDRQVVALHSHKRYTEPGEPPGYIVKVEEIVGIG